MTHAESSYRASPDALGDACRVNSFTPGTPVLLADGTTKPIEDIQIGDVVLATDPQTGETAAKPVTDLIAGHGLKHLVAVTADGHAVTATGGHPFYIHGRGWTAATDLRIGDLLLEADGDWEAIDALRRYDTPTATVHNLTVADIHTYYVQADEPILVHNCGGGVVAKIHGNSLKNAAETHVYRIDGPNGLHKIGESAAGVRLKDGLSIRAEAQVRHLRRGNPGVYFESSIVRVFPNKAAARAYETRALKMIRGMRGTLPPGNKVTR